MVKYKLKPLATAALSSALIVSSLSGFATTADAATKVQKAKDVKIKKGKLVKKSNGKVIKGYVLYKGVIYKDGKTFTGILNKAYYKKGKKATGLYKSKYYKNGALGTGIYKNHYYKSGALGTGTYKGKKYAKGKLLTGLSGKTYYKAGVLGTGSYKGKKYVKGKLFTGLSGKTYYKNGVLGTGSYEGHYYVKGKLATGEFGGILYEAGKPFTGEKDGIIYKDGKKDEDQTNVANFKKAETAVQKANDTFKKAKEQKDALDALAKKAGVSTQANLQTKNAADIDAFLAKYKDVDVAKLEGAEFKSALTANLTLAAENLKAASTEVTNAVNAFVAAATVIASSSDATIQEHIKTAVAATTAVVASLKAAGYDTAQLENALSKLPGGSTSGGGNNNGGGSNPGGGNNGGGSNPGGGETETVDQKFEKLATAQAKVTATQAELDDLLAKQEAIDSMEKDIEKVTQNKKLTVSSEYTVVTTVEEFFERYPEGYLSVTNIENFQKDLNAVKSLLNKEIATTTSTLIKETDTLFWAIKEAVAVALDSNKLQFIKIATLQATLSIKDIKAAGGSATELEKALNNLPASAKPSDTDKIKLVTAKVDALFVKGEDQLANGVTQKQINEAKKLVGTLADSEDKTTLQGKINTAQGLLDKQIADAKLKEATDAVNALLNGEALAADVDQDTINAAQALVDALPEEAQTALQALQATIDKAQGLLDKQIADAKLQAATDAVDALLNTEGNALAADVDQAQIDAAQALVDALPTEAQTALQATIDKAQGLLDKQIADAKLQKATDAVNALLNGEALAADVDQDTINAAQALVDALPEEAQTALQATIDKAQGLLDKQIADAKLQKATDAVNALLKDDALAANVDQAQIDAAQALVEALPEDTEESTIKADLLAKVQKAQDLLNIQEATKAVNALLDGDVLAANVDQAQIDAAQALVEALPEDTEESTTKADLLAKVQKAQDLLNIQEATKAVNALLDGDVLAADLDQAQIDAAQALVNALSPEAQTALQEKIDTAQELFATKLVNDLLKDNALADKVDQAQIVAAKTSVDKVKNDIEGVTTKKDLLAKVQKAQYLLDAKNDIDVNGNLVIQTNQTDINDLFTFQMAGIYLVNGEPTHYTGTTQSQAKTLKTAQVIKGLEATINAKVSSPATTLTDEAFKVTGSTTDGKTTFSITTNLTAEQFNILDDNKNNAYLITVNENSVRKYKILFQLNKDKNAVTAKFVSGSVLDSDFTTQP